MPTEADTCRKFVVPKLQASGWETDPHSILEQRPSTDCRIVPRGKGYIRRPPKRVIEALQDRGIDFQTLALQVGKPDADPFDLLCHLALNAPVQTRRQRADRVKREEEDYFAQFGPEAREILAELLEKYAEDGELQFTLPDVLKVAPLVRHGSVAEIVGKFENPERLRNAVEQLHNLIYAA